MQNLIYSIVVILFITLISAFGSYKLEKNYRQVEANYLHYLLQALVYLIFVIPIWIILFLFTITKGIPLMRFLYVDSLILLIIAISIFNPFLRRMKKQSKLLDDPRILIGINELAAKIGLNINEIRVVNWKRIKIANAFQTGFNHYYIFLSNFLFENLSYNENLAVIAHEMVHATKKHVKKIFIFTEITIFVSTNLFLLGSILTNNLGLAFLFIVAGFVLVYAGLFFYIPVLQRKYEKEADLYAARLTDPNWLIQALSKLAELNLIPKKMSKLLNSSHPDVATRIKYLSEINKDDL